MEEFSFSTRIFFGEGALERLRRVQDKKVMIVTDRFMAGIGVPDKVAGHLTRCQVSVFDGVVPDPPIEVVAAGVQALQDCGAEVMIAVGGGSTIDAAKAIRAVAKETLHIDTDRWECFAVPTTSGTGSEVTDYAVITDRAKEMCIRDRSDTQRIPDSPFRAVQGAGGGLIPAAQTPCSAGKGGETWRNSASAPESFLVRARWNACAGCRTKKL